MSLLSRVFAVAVFVGSKCTLMLLLLFFSRINILFFVCWRRGRGRRRFDVYSIATHSAAICVEFITILLCDSF